VRRALRNRLDGQKDAPKAHRPFEVPRSKFEVDQRQRQYALRLGSIFAIQSRMPPLRFFTRV
jgi:hypothetical protein